MVTPDVNRYESGDALPGAMKPVARRWSEIFVFCACGYYGISAVTLPFTNAVWYGEVPLLAILQVPKSFIKFVVQKFLLHAVSVLGLSYGSASPDYIATHPWAMVIMAALPALFLVTVVTFMLRGRLRGRLVAAVLIFALIDGIVTIGFDRAFRLKLYDAVYF